MIEVSIKKIDQCLPQTQCTQCGYPRCFEYARALKKGEADINQCPPGGDITISLLSGLLDKDKKPLNPENGVHEAKTVAIIHEAHCIGCKLCIKACPVDCIIGANKLMHTVITDQCTGCKLCLPICPTDCISMVSPPAINEKHSVWFGYGEDQVKTARRHTKQKRQTEKSAQRKKQNKITKRKKMQLEIKAALKRTQKKSLNNKNDP